MKYSLVVPMKTHSFMGHELHIMGIYFIESDLQMKSTSMFFLLPWKFHGL